MKELELLNQIWSRLDGYREVVDVMDKNEDAELKNDLGDSPALGADTTDRLVAVGRSIVSAIPGAGGLLAEIITEVIPNQRIDRVEQYLRFLANRLWNLEKSISPEVMKEAESIALIEEGAIQAARSISEERRRYIASCVALGIYDDGSKLKSQRVLDIVSELDDGDLLLLSAYFRRDSKGFEAIRPEPAVIGSEPSVLEDNNLYDRSRKKLEQFGLLHFRISMDRNTGLPEFDSMSGEPRGNYNVSALGKLLLKRVGLEGS
jgi:hypothetical protein